MTPPARILGVGALAATFQGSYFAAVSLTSVSLATLITIGTAPVLVLLAERAAGWRRVDARLVGTAALAVAGLALIVGLPAGFGLAAMCGTAGLALLAAGGFAAVTLLGARPVPGLDELTTVGLGFTAGGLLLAPVAGLTAGLAFRPAPVAVGLLLALGTGPTAVAYTCYLRGLRTVDPTTAALMTLLEPLTAALLAALLLHDRLGRTGLAGAVLLATAMTLAATAPPLRSAVAGQVDGHGVRAHRAVPEP